MNCGISGENDGAIGETVPPEAAAAVKNGLDFLRGLVSASFLRDL